MPDRDTEQHGHSALLLRALIWAGVALAPVAAIVVLLGGSDNSVRFAVLLIAVCVVLIGASMLIRSDPVLLRIDVEDRVAQEVEALREQLREEIAAAARATHHRVQALQDELGNGRPTTAATGPMIAGPAASPVAAFRGEPALGSGGRAVVAAVRPHGGTAPMGQVAAQPMGPAAAQPMGQAGAQPMGQAGAQSMGQAGAQPMGPAAARPVSQAAARSMGQVVRGPGGGPAIGGPGGRAVAGPMGQPRDGGRPVPRQRASVAVPPQAAQVFRPPTGPRRAPAGAVAVPPPRPDGPPPRPDGPPSRPDGPPSRPAVPLPRQEVLLPRPDAPLPRPEVPVRRAEGTPPLGAYGTPRRPKSPPGYDNPGYDGPAHDTAGYPDNGYTDLGHDDLGHDDLGHDDLGHDDLGHDDLGHDDLGYDDAGSGGDSGVTPPSADDQPGPRGSGKRRADVTAVDLGYTGRRSRPDDTTPDDDPMADQYDWRPSGDRW